MPPAELCMASLVAFALEPSRRRRVCPRRSPIGVAFTPWPRESKGVWMQASRGRAGRLGWGEHLPAASESHDAASPRAAGDRIEHVRFGGSPRVHDNQIDRSLKAWLEPRPHHPPELSALLRARTRSLVSSPRAPSRTKKSAPYIRHSAQRVAQACRVTQQRAGASLHSTGHWNEFAFGAEWNTTMHVAPTSAFVLV